MARIKQWKIERRNYLLDLLGGSCISCGAKNNLQFDHVMPDDKLFDISRNLELGLEKILPELQKCQILCRGCHKTKTSNDYGMNTHGTIAMYQYGGCKCIKCKSAWAYYCRPRLKAYRQTKRGVVK